MKPGIFLDLVTHDQIPKVVSGFERAVVKSFIDDQQPGCIVIVTGAADAGPRPEEVKRRSQLCLKIFKALRGDLSWGVDRILDQLPKFLRCELDNVSWEPDARRASWSPT